MKNWILALSLFTGITTASAHTPTEQNLMSKRGNGLASENVVYYGGPVLSNVKIYAVFWGSQVNAEVQAKIGDFYTALSNSTYIDLLGQYSTPTQAIHRGSFAGAKVITPHHPGLKLIQSDIEAELIVQFDEGNLPKPDANSLYMFHFPPHVQITAFGSQSCQGWCGDHEAIKNNSKYGNVAYAMIPDMGGACSFGCYGSGSALSSMTIVTSHEIAEAITDPVSPAQNEKPAKPAAWLTPGESEIGDLCVGKGSSLKTPSITYVVQDEWDNASKACKKDVFQ